MSTAAQHAPDPMLPRPFRVRAVRRELVDTFTLDLVPADGGPPLSFLPGQFNMVYHFGVGEVPISISGDPADTSVLVHTIRAVGGVTKSMAGLKRGDVVGIRGPYGTGWPVQEAEGSDVAIICGGIGLAPLRPAILSVLAHRGRYGKVVILYGSRTPTDMLYPEELHAWRARFDLKVRVTVDRATEGWGGNVGVVPKLISRAGFDPPHTVAMVCGPEVMMKYTVDALNEHGVTSDRIHVSMERNMKCAVGFCGHCQMGSRFVCKDGPVFRFDQIENLFRIREV